MQSVLLFQSRLSPGKATSEQNRFQRATGGLASYEFKFTTDESLDWQRPEKLVAGYDAIMFGGSSDFFFDGGRDMEARERKEIFEILERVKPLLAYVLEKEIPLLAICLGHQIFAEAYGGSVTHDHVQRKMGTYEVRLTEEGQRDALLGELGPTFLAHYAHRDSVTSLPHGATLLADGPSCRYSALRYGTRAYTMQFHPELVAADLLGSPAAISEYLKPDESITDVVKDAPISGGIIRKFLDIISVH